MSTVYMAYGSNLNLEQMGVRCPGAEVLGPALLEGYGLLFRGVDGGAVATVEPKEGGSVPVLLWTISPEDERALDRYEGWPRLYRKETLRVSFGGKRTRVMAYIMNDGYPPALPGRNYLQTISEGYESAGFDVRTLLAAVQRSGQRRRAGN